MSGRDSWNVEESHDEYNDEYIDSINSLLSQSMNLKGPLDGFETKVSDSSPILP
jgi:hypothetical protein